MWTPPAKQIPFKNSCLLYRKASSSYCQNLAENGYSFNPGNQYFRTKTAWLLVFEEQYFQTKTRRSLVLEAIRWDTSKNCPGIENFAYLFATPTELKFNEVHFLADIDKLMHTLRESGTDDKNCENLKPLQNGMLNMSEDRETSSSEVLWRWKSFWTAACEYPVVVKNYI